MMKVKCAGCGKEVEIVEGFEDCAVYCEACPLPLEAEEEVPVCECGSDEAFAELREALDKIDSDGAARGKGELVAHLLDRLGLVEHGSSIVSCWLTPKGKRVLQWLRSRDE